MKKRIGVLNIVSLIILSFIVFFVSGFLFLGSKEDYDRITSNLATAILVRLSGGLIVGYFGLLVVLVINFLAGFFETGKDFLVRIKYLLLYSVLFLFAAGIIGGIFFLNCG